MRPSWKSLLTWSVVLSGVGIAVGLAVLLGWTALSARASAPRVLAGAPVVARLLAPTLTPIVPLSTATPVITPTPTAEALPPPPAGDIGVGLYVQVVGVGVDGLRLRADPGLQGDVRFLGIEAEVFQVKDGPRQLDGYTWWLLVAPYDTTRQGWAVANYLQVIQNP